MAGHNIVHENKQGSFTLPISYESIEELGVSDVDLVVIANDGQHFVLPKAAYEAMGNKPPNISFSDRSLSADRVMKEVGEVKDLAVNQIYKTFAEEDTPSPEEVEKLKSELEKTKNKVEEQKQKLEKEKEFEEELKEQKVQLEQQRQQIEEQAEQLAASKAKIESQGEENIADDHDATVQAPASTKEASVSKYTEEMKRVIEETSTKDYDYTPPNEFSPPPQSYAGPPGVPAPLSMTPLVSLSMGNVVGTQSSVSGSTTTFLGGGGAVGSEALADLGPRNAMQFSSATITGTDGDDVIRSQGPLVGNSDPAVNIDNYSKQFVLSVAGYFTSLDDVIFTGIPDFVSITNATKQPNGSWVLPSENIMTQQAFEFVYDKDAWRSEPQDYFDAKIEISGEMRKAPFSSDDTFRFQFMDVTDASQVMDPTLTAWLDSQTKQIYVLPTMDQPNIIAHGEGDDFVYGGQSHDTITGGDGDNEVVAYEGDNIITEGDGNNVITTLDGNDTIAVGDGSNTITISGGVNDITVGNGDNNTLNIAAGTNTILVGSGNNNRVNTGSGNDHITLHDLAATSNFITDTGGDNVLSVDAGDNTIVTGDGDDQITVTTGSGTNSINAGEGDNSIYLKGTGFNTINAGDGANTFYTGLGVNNFTVGTGVNTLDYSLATTSLTIDMQAGTSIDDASGGADVSDTFSNVFRVHGSDHGDTISGHNSGTTIYGGSSANTINGGLGVDYIYAGAGGDTIDGGGGADFLYGSTGSDSFLNPTAGSSYDGSLNGTVGGSEYNSIDYSSETASMTIDLLQGTGLGGRADGSTYTNINHIISGSGSDTITAGNANTILEGGGGTNRLTGGYGNDELIGGSSTDYLRGNGGDNILRGNSGTNIYYTGIGNDRIDASPGAWDRVYYSSSPSGVVVNLDTSDHVFVDLSGATRTVAAMSGTSYVSATDTTSYAIGDTYMTDGGGYVDIEMVDGSSYQDYIIGNSSTTDEQRYYGRYGDDTIIGSSNTGSDFYYNTSGGCTYDGLNGANDIFYLHRSSGVTAYLDGTADIDGNGTADYLDKGISSLGDFAGFASYGSYSFLKNIDNLYGAAGNDTMVGDANNNHIYGAGGINLIHGLGGDDLITVTRGNDIIDGGSGTDTITFISEGPVGRFVSNLSEGVEAFLSNATSLDGHNSSLWGNGAQAHTVYDGFDLYSTVANVENIHGTNYGDYLAGDAAVNYIEGNNGDDWITGNGGADTLYGESGSDTIIVKASDVATLNIADGGSGTDTLMLTPDTDGGAHFTFSPDFFSGRNYTNFEIVDARDQSDPAAVTAYNYELNANDIQKLVNTGTSSTLTLRLDTGDVFTPVVGASTGALSFVNTINTATDMQYRYYSDLGNTNLTATVNVHFGVV